MAKKFWWPKRIVAQMALVKNFKVKFPGIAPELGFSAEDIVKANEICDSILGAFQYAQDLSRTMKAATAWRNYVFYSKQKGESAMEPAVLPAPPPQIYLAGSVDLFFGLRDRIMATPKYADSIGKDLGLIGPEKERLSAATTSPDLKITINASNRISVKGSLKGCDALQVQYAADGENFVNVGFLTRTPGEILLKTKEPGVPEKGSVRAIFIKANHQFGSFSSQYPVALW